MVKMAFLPRAVPVAVVSFMLLSDIFQTSRAQFTAQPASYIELDSSLNTLAALECSYNSVNTDDVIGWVVGSQRISNGNNLDTELLGPELSNDMQLSLVPNDDGSFTYGLDFFTPSRAAAGDYKCQLCQNDGNGECGSVIAESDVSEVRVLYEPTSQPTCLPPAGTSTRVTLGESVMLSCASDPGLPVVSLEWRLESDLISDEAVVMSGVLYNNFSYSPGASDTALPLTCTMRASETNTQSCSSSTLLVVSTPVVSIQPPNPMQIPVGASATYVCQASSPTSTAISSYSWTVDVPASRLDVNGDEVTIRDVSRDDHGKSIRCEATDQENMIGSFEYFILVAGEVVPSDLPTLPPVSFVPSSSIPGTTALPSSEFPLAAIIVIVVVAVILLCIVLGGVWFFCNKKKHQKPIPSTTVVKNNLSPTSATHFTNEKAFTFPNVDPSKSDTDPDVIPKGMNERPVDVKSQWRDSGPPNEYSPTIKSVNMPFQSKGSKTNLDHDPYNYNPAYDDKVDPADLDFKAPLDDQDYSDSGIGYRDGDNGYPDEKYGKPYNDGYFNDGGYGDRPYGDGHQDPYAQDFGGPYSGDQNNYGRVYDDDYQSAPAQYGSGYDAYPDRMPDGSEGYDPAPEEYNDQAYNGYNQSSDYGRISDYGAPADYNNDQPAEYGYNDQPGGYDDDYDHQPSGPDYPQDGYDHIPQQSYHEDHYNDQPQDSYYPDRVPDGGAPGSEGYDYGYSPEGEPYNDQYGGHTDHYDDGTNYASPGAQYDDYDPSYQQLYQSPAHSQPYIDPEDEVSATSNPSYV